MTLKVMNAKYRVYKSNKKETTMSAYAKYILGASTNLSKALKLMVINIGVRINRNNVTPNLINPFCKSSLFVLICYNFL